MTTTTKRAALHEAPILLSSPHGVEIQHADIITAVRRRAAKQSTCWVSIYTVADDLGCTSQHERDWLLDAIAHLDECDILLLGHLNEPHLLPAWAQTFKVQNSLHQDCHEVAVNPTPGHVMRWQVEHGTADVASFFAAAAAASLQCLAGEQDGLRLDHRTLMRRAMPTVPQAPLTVR